MKPIKQGNGWLSGDSIQLDRNRWFFYNYDNGAYTGEFPAGERGIGYSQRFSMPYIGLVGQYRINDFEFNALFKFSDWVRAHDNDEHYMRDLTFREKTTSSRYYGTSIDADIT